MQSLLALLATDAAAQSYPSRPITIIAPTTAGGPPDTIARLLSEPMRAVLGQPIVVENVTGAGSTLGVGRVARSAPDGYTLSIGHLNSHVFSSLTYPVTYDVVNDFEPISLITIAPMALFGRIGLPGADAKELVAWLKANPDKASFGTVGVGGPARVWATDFQSNVGTRFQFVPYRGAFAIVQDIVGGQIDIGYAEGSNILTHLKGGKLKAYAIAANTRWAAAPEVPTIERGRHTRTADAVLAWHLGAQGHAARRRRQAQRRGDARAGGSRRCARGWRRWARRFIRASNKPSRRSPLTTRPRSRSGAR